MKLSVQGLNSYYGPAHILFDVALEVGDGEVVALLGRNGAGKSTTFRSIVGLVEQREGQIIFEGRDVSNQPTHAIVSNGLGYVPEERRIFTDLTVDENLEVGRQQTRSNAFDLVLVQDFIAFDVQAPITRAVKLGNHFLLAVDITPVTHVFAPLGVDDSDF